MGLGWGNYLISVRRRRARLPPLGLESDRETKRAGERSAVRGKRATDGGQRRGPHCRDVIREEARIVSKGNECPASCGRSPRPEPTGAATASSHRPRRAPWPLRSAQARVRKGRGKAHPRRRCSPPWGPEGSIPLQPQPQPPPTLGLPPESQSRCQRHGCSTRDSAVP